MNSRDPDFEERLRRAWVAPDAPAGFVERVLAAAERRRTQGVKALEDAETPAGAEARAPAGARPRGEVDRRPLFRRGGWMAAAATLAIVAIAGGTGLTLHQHSQALRAHIAREQVLQALRISSEALNAALAAAAHPTPPGES